MVIRHIAKVERGS